MRDLIAKAVSSLGLGELAAAGRLFRSWEEIVGPEVAARSQPLSLRDGVLRIQTDSPAWAAEVRYLAPELLRRANAALGRELARELKVSLRPAAQDGRGRRGSTAEAGAQWPGPKPPETSGGRRERDAASATRPQPDPSAKPPPRSSILPIRDERLADAVSRVLDAAQANRRDNKGGKRAR
jgi:Dna[CI] antecedent DciA-like protein